MGYTLKIGEAYLDFDKKYAYLSINAEAIELPEAPAFGEGTDNLNQRWPSYIAWSNFCNELKLHDLFFNKEDGLMKEHSGHAVLTQEHKTIIDKAYTDYYTKHPNCKAGYSPKIDEAKGIYEDPDWPEENNYAVRLEWLKFWVDWALENCEIPIFYNS